MVDNRLPAYTTSPKYTMKAGRFIMLGYSDPNEAKAVELTIGAVEYAARFNAPAVVIHPGEVPVPRDYNRLLEDMLLDGRKETEEYRALYKEMIELRSSGSPAYVELIRQSLEQICDYIERKNYKVALGLENRTRCYQIPVFQEVHTLLKGLEGLPVYFWYDVGHGMLLEQMGMFDNYEEAEQLVEQTIGAHIHDIIDCASFCPYQYPDKLDKYLDIIGQIPTRFWNLTGHKPDEIRRSAEIHRKAGKISKGVSDIMNKEVFMICSLYLF